MLWIGVVEVGRNALIPLRTRQQQRGTRRASDEQHGPFALGTRSGDGRDSQMGVEGWFSKAAQDRKIGHRLARQGNPEGVSRKEQRNSNTEGTRDEFRDKGVASRRW
jgi:hypothetical protein